MKLTLTRSFHKLALSQEKGIMGFADAPLGSMGQTFIALLLHAGLQAPMLRWQMNESYQASKVGLGLISMAKQDSQLSLRGSSMIWCQQKKNSENYSELNTKDNKYLI